MDLDHPDINTSELTAQVRKSMARQVLKRQARFTNGVDLENTPQPASPPDAEEDNSTLSTLSTDVNFASLNSELGSLPKSPQLESQPGFERDNNVLNTLNDLLKLHDAEFLSAAYRLILQREPDSLGYDFYLEQLREGHVDQVDVLTTLRFSSEGRLKNVQIKGLALPAFMRRLGQLPVIGYPIRLGIDLLRLPVLIHRARQHEARLLAQNRRVTEHANKVAKHADRVNDVTVGYLSNLSTAIADLSNRSHLGAEHLRQLKEQLETVLHQQGTLVNEQQTLAEQQTILTKRQETVNEQQRTLVERHESLAEQHQTLAEQQTTLSAQQGTLAVQHGTLTEQHGVMAEQQSDLAEKQGTLAEKQQALVEQQKALAQQQGTLAEQQGDLVEQQETLAKDQQRVEGELRLEFRAQIDGERAERARTQDQTQHLIQAQQSLIESAINDSRVRIDQLESSARAWIAQLESSARAWTAELETKARAENAELESAARVWTTDLKSAFDEKLARVESSTRDISTKVTESESTTNALQSGIDLVASSANNLRAATDKLESSTHTTQAEIENVYRQLRQTRTELTLQRSRIALILDEARTRLPASIDHEQVDAIALEEQHKLDALYAELEDNFRGSYEEIKERSKTYLPHIKSLGVAADMPIVDLGCGRGEWLELLKEEGYRATGVDTNQVLIERCRDRGLEVIESDALKYLRGLPDNSLSAVTGFHIIEHLQIQVLMNLLDEIVRVLHPGGLVIFETPNPDNVLVGSNFFYFDPTHRNPLPSLLMKFLLESRGLDRIEVMNLHAWDQAHIGGKNELTARFNELFYGPMDYAIAGWKGSK